MQVISIQTSPTDSSLPAKPRVSAQLQSMVASFSITMGMNIYIW